MDERTSLNPDRWPANAQRITRFAEDHRWAPQITDELLLVITYRRRRQGRRDYLRVHYAINGRIVSAVSADRALQSNTQSVLKHLEERGGRPCKIDADEH